jgi:hypothetical protein
METTLFEKKPKSDVGPDLVKQYRPVGVKAVLAAANASIKPTRDERGSNRPNASNAGGGREPRMKRRRWA